MLLKTVNALSNELSQLKTENINKSKSYIEKCRVIKRNPTQDYATVPANATFWLNAVKAMANATKTISLSYTLQEYPYDYLLGLCAHSNPISSTFGLIKAQQRLLILSCIPEHSNLYKEVIGFNSLEQLFAYPNLLCTSVETKVQTEMQLDNWVLDLSSINACNQSISKLKTLLIDTEQMDIQNPNTQLLYTLMIKRLKKEKITTLAKNTLSLIEPDVRTETSAIALHSKY